MTFAKNVGEMKMEDELKVETESSLYEQWKWEAALPWTLDGCVVKCNGFACEIADLCDDADAKLIAAAPEMLDALIFVYGLFGKGSPMAAEFMASKIRAALPEAVSDEVLKL